MTAIVILGAAVWPDGPSPTLLRRTRHAAALWHENQNSIVIPCGGLGKHGPTEAQVMLDILVAEGVSPSMIEQEDQSSTTYENLRNAAAILNTRNIQDITIVTNGYHGPRAKLVAWTLGLHAKISAPDITGAHKPTHYRMAIREMIALPAYAIKLIWWRWRDRAP